MIHFTIVGDRLCFVRFNRTKTGKTASKFMLKIVWRELCEGQLNHPGNKMKKREDMNEIHDLQRWNTPGQKQV